MPWYLWGIFFVTGGLMCSAVHLLFLNGYNALIKQRHSNTPAQTCLFHFIRVLLYFYHSIRLIMVIFSIGLVIEQYSNWYPHFDSSWVTYVGWAATVLYFPTIKMHGAWLALSLLSSERELAQDIKDDDLGLLILVVVNAGVDGFFFFFTFCSAIGIFIPGFFTFVPQPFTIIGLCLGVWFSVWFLYQMMSCVRNCFCNICFPNTGKGLDRDTYAYLDDTANSFMVIFILFAIYWTSIVSGMNFVTNDHTWTECYIGTMFGDYCPNGFQLDYKNWKIALITLSWLIF